MCKTLFCIDDYAMLKTNTMQFFFKIQFKLYFIKKKNMQNFLGIKSPYKNNLTCLLKKSLIYHIL